MIWLCLFSITTGALCLNLVVRQPFISLSSLGFWRVCSAAISMTMDVLVPLHVACKSSNSTRVRSALHFLIILDLASFNLGFLVLFILNLKSTLVGYCFFLANFPSMTLMFDGYENFLLRSLFSLRYIGFACVGYWSLMSTYLSLSFCPLWLGETLWRHLCIYAVSGDMCSSLALIVLRVFSVSPDIYINMQH